MEIKKILHPTDFSEYAGRALPYVEDLAKLFNAEVTVLHVIAPVFFAAQETVGEAATVMEMMEATARARVQELTEKLKRDGIKAVGKIIHGSPFVEIVSEAKKENSDLIVLATHGSGAIAHLLMGSTAERVVRKSPCPVLTVRDPEHKYVHPGA